MLLAPLSSCAVSRTLDARTVYRYPPNEIGCAVKQYENMVYPPDSTRFEMLGTVVFQRRDGDPVVQRALPEHQRGLATLVCQWGGDGFLLASQVHVGGGLPWWPNSTYTYAVVRELRQGEVSSTSQLLGISDEKLKQQVAFDEDCASEQIQIISKQEDQGAGSYRVRACGKERRYRRVGTVYTKTNADP